MLPDRTTRHNDHFFVITGGPGSGKSTLIEKLIAMRYFCIPEVARQIIQEQVAADGDALPWKNALAYRDMMLERTLRTYCLAEKMGRGHVVFDRGIPDVIGYSHIINAPVPAMLKAAAWELRYNTRVFITPPWKDIYENDAERKQTFSESVAVHEMMVNVYTTYGYTLVELPRAPVIDRIGHIIENLG